MAELAVSQFGGLDCLVTAAGISHANYVSGDIEPDIKILSRTGLLTLKGQDGNLWKQILIRLTRS